MVVDDDERLPGKKMVLWVALLAWKANILGSGGFCAPHRVDQHYWRGLGSMLRWGFHRMGFTVEGTVTL